MPLSVLPMEPRYWRLTWVVFFLFPINGIFDDQNSLSVGIGCRIGVQQGHAPVIDRRDIHRRFGDKELEPLDGSCLGTDKWLGIGYVFSGQATQQTVQIVAKMEPLRERVGGG